MSIYGDQPVSPLAAARRAWVSHLEHCTECLAATLNPHARRCARGEGIRRAAVALGLFHRARIEQKIQRKSVVDNP